MKALFVGLGGVGQRHLRNLRTLRGDGVEVIAWRTRRLSRALNARLEVEAGEDVERKYGVRAYPTLEEALAARPDVAFICNPSSLHLPAALAAARAGCHLFLEKPVSHSLDGLDDLRREVRQRKLATMVGYQLRFHPLLQRLHALLQAGAVGRVVAVQAEVGEYLPGWHPYEDYREMYAARRDLGGGVVLSQIHEMDYLYWLFGLPRRVFAVGGHLSRLEIDVEDVASITLEFAGPQGTFPAHVHEDYLQRPSSRTCKVLGDAGKIELDLRALWLRAYDRDGALAEEKTLPDFERNQMLLDELSHFLACVEGAKPIVDLDDGIASLRMALAARQSMETSEVVRLETLPR